MRLGPRYRIPRARDGRLTVRQLDILAAAAAGHTIDEIAGRFRLSIETVKSHRKNTLAALTARSTTHAVAIAYERGLLPRGEA